MSAPVGPARSPNLPQANRSPASPQADRSRPYRLVAVLMLLAALGGIALATLGASADRGPLGSYEGATRESRSQPTVSTSPIELPTGETATATAPPRKASPSDRIAPMVLAVLFGAALLALVVWLLVRMRALARPPLEEADDLPEQEELTADQARSALAEARRHLSSVVDAHDAVVAAWLALERAIAAVGIRRRPSQTTLEYVVEVLADVDLDPGELDRLAHLYRRALFDAQPLTETDREQALALLDALTAQLDRARTGAS